MGGLYLFILSFRQISTLETDCGLNILQSDHQQLLCSWSDAVSCAIKNFFLSLKFHVLYPNTSVTRYALLWDI